MIELEKTTNHSVTSYGFQSVNSYIMTFGESERIAIEKAIMEAEKQKQACVNNIDKFAAFIDECNELLKKY